MRHVDYLFTVRRVAIDQNTEAKFCSVSHDESHGSFGTIEQHRALGSLIDVRCCVLPVGSNMSFRGLDGSGAVTAARDGTVRVNVDLPSLFPLGRAALIVVVPRILETHVTFLAPRVRDHGGRVSVPVLAVQTVVGEVCGGHGG